MSKSSLNIVLVDPLGDVLFSGESLSMLPAEPPPPAPEVHEPCPETLRSVTTFESGLFPSVAFTNDDGANGAGEIKSSRTRAA